MNTKQYKNVVRGYQNHNVGQCLENTITSACNFYSMQGIAEIEKTPEPMKIIGSLGNNQFRTVFSAKAQPDYKGIYKGKTQLFEAKATMSDRISQNVVTERQWDKFERYEAQGADCYVIVSLELKSYFRIPWTIWRDMKCLFGHKYMSDSELISSVHRLSFCSAGTLDFLNIYK